MKTAEEAPIVYMLTYKQTDYIGLPVWFGVVSLLFFVCVSVRSKPLQTYLSLTHHCDAVRTLLGEQYRPAFLTSLSSISYRHTMTALITSLHSHH